MSEKNKIVENQDRLALKQERKERKLLKKTLKRQEQERENDKRKLELRLGPKDQHVTIISKDIADNINKAKEIFTCSNNSDFNFGNINDSFPVLNNATKSKQKHVKTIPHLPTTSTTNEQTFPAKQAKVNTLTINLAEILNIKTKPIVAQKSVTKEVQKYDGNILDSSQPKRHKGKHREVLKPKPLTKLKSQIIADMKNSTNCSSFNFYDNIITEELDTIVKELLCSIVRFQENLYNENPIKGTARRRYITGFREVKKYLFVNKIKFLIIAPNIKLVKDGALDTIIHELISSAVDNNIPYVFALSRRKLGQITQKYIPISCVGIFYYDGVEQLFNNIMELLETLRMPNESQEYETENGIINVLSNNTNKNC